MGIVELESAIYEMKNSLNGFKSSLGMQKKLLISVKINQQELFNLKDKEKEE